MFKGSEASPQTGFPGARRRVSGRASTTYVVAFDGSESAWRALDLATPLPRAGDTLALVDVIPVRVQDTPAAGEPASATTTSYRDEVARAEQVLADAAARFSGNGLNTTTQVLIGDPASEICRYAEAAQADVIVVGGRTAPTARDQARQTVADSVLHRSARPVLVCR